MLIENTTVHKEYVKASKINDIALIHLKADVKFTSVKNVETICLPVKPDQMIENLAKQEEDPLKMTISGWGFTEKNTDISDILMHALVPFLEQNECASTFKTLRNRFSTIDFDILETHLVK